MWTNLRLKVRRFFKKNKYVILIIIIIWLIVFAVNKFVQYQPPKLEATTTYTPDVAVLDSTSQAPKEVQDNAERLVEEYVGYCNEGLFEKAFNMISEECKKYEFNNKLSEFLRHVYTKMPTEKLYSIQNYSNYEIGGKKVYIYEVKYTDDYLATGLVGQDYTYTVEKISVYKDKDGVYQINVGDFMYYTESIKGMTENEYMKVDTVYKLVNYSIEVYEVRITNKSQYTIVIYDGQEADEVVLQLPHETRLRSEISDIVLRPGDSNTYTFTFKKFADDGDVSQNITFSAVRIMEKYSGTEVDQSIIEDEINNAIAKFSMSVSVLEK